jgi:hypothetical protein
MTASDPHGHQTSQTVQLIAVKLAGKKWLAWKLRHSDLQLAEEQVQKKSKESLHFKRLEVRSCRITTLSVALDALCLMSPECACGLQRLLASTFTWNLASPAANQ